MEEGSQLYCRRLVSLVYSLPPFYLFPPPLWSCPSKLQSICAIVVRCVTFTSILRLTVTTRKPFRGSMEQCHMRAASATTGDYRGCQRGDHWSLLQFVTIALAERAQKGVCVLGACGGRCSIVRAGAPQRAHRIVMLGQNASMGARSS